MPAVAMNSSSVQSTPSRDRTQTFRSETSSASPSTVRVAQTTTTTSNSAAAAAAPLTLQGLLEAHATAADPCMAALESAIADRNTLSAQNAQLWKLIERQRTGYAQLMKEIERVRGERDVYRSRLQAMGESTDALLRAHRERERREGRDPLRSAASHAHLRSSDSLNTNGSSAQESRANLLRASSEDIVSQRNINASTGGPGEYQQPNRPMGRERQGSQNSLNVPFSTSQLSNSYLSASQASSSSQLNLAAPPSGSVSAASSSAHLPLSNTERSPEFRRVYPPPPHSPQRSGSLPTSTHSSADSLPAEDASHSALPPPAMPMPPSTAKASLASVDSQVESQAGPSSGHRTQPHVVVQPASAVEPQANGNGIHPRSSQDAIYEEEEEDDLAPPSRPYMLRESPSGSPSSQQGTFTSRSTSGSPEKLSGSPYQRDTEPQAALLLPGQHAESLRHPYGDPSQNGSRRPGESSEFTEMDETDSAYDSINESGKTSAVDPVEIEDQPATQQQEGAIGPNLSRKDRKRAAAEDFPLPPTSPPTHAGPEALTQSQLQQQQYQALQRMRNESGVVDASQAQATKSNGLSRQVVDAPSAIAQSQSTWSELSQASSASTTVPLSELAAQAPFRALPLLATDLPQTTIEVCNSTIRPNDRGKEVLSFSIAVQPGRGKEGWRVEKLYSDVLTLDARVRASIGKSMGKKLVTLPEGRLWKDHAPAKVDQRKVALEQYLRSLIALPVKNKDEVVAFFTSDIVRLAQKPVMQAGYKEGYLTKRGKNFGGWKTRFFVLQGPSLEYYESRGGTHLGSILITGAQIGRQQRSPDKKETDEDNEYRHAFLIIEAKRGPGGSSSRHVLCAESDAERDSWVEVLVRYVTGTYNDEEYPLPQPGSSAQSSVGRLSSSSTIDTPPTPTRRPRKEDIVKTSAVPVSQLALDASNAKLSQSATTLSDDASITSPVKSAPAGSYVDLLTQSSAEIPISSSLPVSSPLGGDDADDLAPVGQRANSEMGHYPDMDQRATPSKSKAGVVSPDARRKDRRKSMNPLKPSPIPERTPSPETDAMLQTPRVDARGKVKISGPMNGTPIPAGYKFGGKDAPSEAASNDRREKAKSRSFWGFGGKHDKPNAPVHVPRAVFGVSLEESLEIAEIAGLPAIVFRCIQYLEAKKADQEEGIYRLSGSSAVIKALKDRFNNEGDVDLLGSDEYWDPHAISGLLKTYLRELPASILTRDLHLRFLSVIDFVDPQERITELSQLIASLPVVNYSLLRALTAHLILIVQNAHVNKMTMRNVGIVFSPTLGIPAGVFSLMLGEFTRVFNVDGSLQPEETDDTEEAHEAAALSRRNSKHYSDAAADQLLGLSGRTLTAPEDSQSDGDELSVHDESGTEGTDNAEVESIVESSAASSTAYLAAQTQDYDDNQALSPDAPRSRASDVAANLGLNIATSDKASKRYSRMVGLPHSPRPPLDTSSPHTPVRAGSSPIGPSPLHPAR